MWYVVMHRRHLIYMQVHTSHTDSVVVDSVILLLHLSTRTLRLLTTQLHSASSSHSLSTTVAVSSAMVISFFCPRMCPCGKCSVGSSVLVAQDFFSLVWLIWSGRLSLVAVSVGSSVPVAQDFFLLLARCFFLLVVSSDVMSPR